jgi:phage terminase large subunit-like protein
MVQVAFGLTFLAIVAITIAVSMAVFLKVRKMTFRMQRNIAYQGATITNNQDVVMAESTILYNYPAADNDESERSTTAIITERNEAFSATLHTRYTRIKDCIRDCA